MDWKQRLEKWGADAIMFTAIVTVLLWSHTSLSCQMDQIHEDIRCAHVRIDSCNFRIDAQGARTDLVIENNQKILMDLNSRMDHTIANNQKILLELIKERTQKKEG